MDVLSLLSCLDHSSAVDHISQMEPLAFVVFTKSYLLSYLSQLGWIPACDNPVRLDKMPDVGKYMANSFFACLAIMLPHLP